MTTFKLGKYKINHKSKPFIIAELSANHNGKLSNIYSLIDKAKKSGADAIKLQSYTPDSMTINSKRQEFLVKEGLWKGSYLYDLYVKGTTPESWHKKIFNYAKKKKKLCFSTPFDIKAVKFLSKLNTPAFKVASFEITDIPLIEAVSRTGKPIIFSTGMASIKDIDIALSVAKKSGAKQIALLHCISKYPTEPKDYNLKFISKLIKKYNLIVGLSDHTIGSITAVSSIPLGAKIIEKHIKLPGESGLDGKFSMDTNEFSKFVKMIQEAHLTLGDENFNRNKNEKEPRLFRRSIFVSENIDKNEKISENNIKVVRPAYGLHPIYKKYVIGKKLKLSLKKGTPLKLSHLDVKRTPKLI